MRQQPFPQYQITGTQISFTTTDVLNKQKVTDCDVESKDEGTLGSISDRKMYPASTDKTCQTCNMSRANCLGHYGRWISPVCIMTKLTSAQLIAILNSVCTNCGEILLETSFLESQGIMRLNGAKRLIAIAKANSKAKRMCRNQTAECQHYRLYSESDSATSTKFTADWRVFCRMDGNSKGFYIELSRFLPLLNELDHDPVRRQLLGLMPESGVDNINRGTYPSSFVIQHLTIIPENNRPSVKIAGQEQIDHITGGYRTLIKLGNQYNDHQKKQNVSAMEKTSTDIAKEIYKIYYGNSTAQISKKSEGGGPAKERISEKHGILRSNTMAKRDDHTARTVLNPANLPFGFMGVPMEMDGLTIREMVYSRNLMRMRALMKAGRIVRVETPTRNINISRRQIDVYEVQIGDIVERMAEDGDEVIFNRQPTLHRQSLMGYMTMRRKELTFGHHSAVTNPHNMD